MQKKFLSNLVLLLLLNLLIKPFWVLGVDRAVQNTVGAEEYGLYFALLNFSFLLNILLDAGITNFNNKNIAQNHELLSEHFPKITILKFLLAVGYGIITIGFGVVLGYGDNQMHLLGILVFNQFLLSLILYLRSNISGLHLFRTDSIISILDRGLMILICSVLLWGNVTEEPFKIEWFIYTQTAAYSIVSVIAFLVVVSRTNQLKFAWDVPFFKKTLKNSFPFAILLLLMTFYNRIDTVMMERMLSNGAEQAGIYAQGYRLLDAVNMIAYLFAVLLLPIFAKMIAQNVDSRNVEELVRLSFSIIIVPAIIIAATSFFYSRELMQLLYVEHIDESAIVFGVLMICFVAISSTYIFGTLLTANGNMKGLNYMALCAISSNIILNVFFIPRWGALGAAMASVLTQFIASTIQIGLVQYNFRFKVNYKFLITLGAFIGCTILMGKYTYGLTEQWQNNIIIMGLASLILAFVLKLISISAIKNVLKQSG